MPGLEYIEDGHIYKYNNVVVPSVTQVLSTFIKTTCGGYDYYIAPDGSAIPADNFEMAGDHGRAIHQAVEIILKHGADALDWDGLHESLPPSLEQFVQWTKDYAIEPLVVETPMYSEKLGVAGTSDIVGASRNKLILVDVKTGDSTYAGPQTAGYELLYREHAKYRGRIYRYTLALPKDGTKYKFIPHTDKDDEAFFRARLFQHQYLARRKQNGHRSGRKRKH